LRRTYPLLYDCPRKQRPRGESGPFSSVSQNPGYRSCFQRLSPTHSRMKRHLKYTNKHLMSELSEHPVFRYHTKIDSIPPKLTSSLQKQPPEKFSCERVSPSWTGCIKNKTTFLFQLQLAHQRTKPRHIFQECAFGSSP